MSNDGVNAGRRRFLVAATSVVGAAGAVGAAVPFVGSWFPSAKAKAAGAPVKVNVSKIEPGQQMIAEWRGQPVSRDLLAREVWKVNRRLTPLDNVIDVHLSHLREKIDKDQPAKLIQTVRGVGFRLAEDGA